MLDQILAGTPVTLGLAAWAAYGPALAVGLLALVLLALPSLRSRPTTARRPEQVVMRANDNVAIGAYAPGLVLGVIAAALAYYGSRPQVVIAADSLTCRPWTRPLQMSEIRSIGVGDSGRVARPAVHVDIAFASEMRRGGVPTRIEEVVIAMLRGPSALVARERPRGEGTCPLGGLAIDGREAAHLIQVAWGRAAAGRLPDVASAGAVEAFCASPPARIQSGCAELMRRAAEQCRGIDGTAGLACRYEVALGERASPVARPPAAPASPPAASPAPPTVTPTQPRPAAPTPPVATPAPPAPGTPAPPPVATPQRPTSPAGSGKPPATPGAAPPGSPSAPPGKPS